MPGSFSITKLHPREPPAPPGAPLNDHPPIDAEDGPIDVVGVLRGEKDVDPCELFRPAHPTQRNPAIELVQDLFGHAIEHIGADQAGGDGVDADALAAELTGPDLGHADHTSLRGCVASLTEVAVTRSD